MDQPCNGYGRNKPAVGSFRPCGSLGSRRAEGGKGGGLMFTFVVWAIGLYILFKIAGVNLSAIAVAFELHWFLGILAMIGSLIGWVILLALIF